jgi:preprotein translocase subunit SecF
MWSLRFLRKTPNIPFMRLRLVCFAMSLALLAIAAGSTAVQGLNFGIDFRGGVLLEVKTNGPADLGQMRDTLDSLGLGEVTLQEFGAADDVLIRVQEQPGGDEAQRVALERIKSSLGDSVSEYRRTEVVGPTVGDELIEAGILAVVLALGAIMIYIWFRFEWQYSVGAIVALIHDVIITIGLYSVTGIEFNLSTVAAILTIAGYSINDTVVVYDRVREMVRKFKRMPLADLLDLSVNATLSRTLMTSLTTLIALVALFIFGGEVIRGFVTGMIFGIVIGTYSSIFVAGPLLIYLGIRRSEVEDGEGQPEAASGTS